MTNSDKQFIESAAPEFWYTYANELADTADAIYRTSKDQWVFYNQSSADGSLNNYKRPLISRPVMLLYGLSFENIIKGLLISEEPNLLQGGKLSKHLLGHDLVKLAGRLKSIQLVDKELELLALLSDVVPYLGRYPVPRKAQELKPEKYISEDIHTSCRALFLRFEMQIYRLNFQGIDAPEGVRFANLRLLHLDPRADFITDEIKLETQKSLRRVISGEGGASN